MQKKARIKKRKKRMIFKQIQFKLKKTFTQLNSFYKL